MILRAPLLLLTATLIAVAQTESDKTWSVLDENAVTVEDGPRFTIPAAWVARHAKRGDCLHFAASALKSVGTRRVGDFDREYNEILAGAFDVERCRFHGGSEGFGASSSSYADLHLRIYRIPGKIVDVKSRLDGKGAEALRTILSPARTAERNAAGMFGVPPKKSVEEDAPPQPLEKFRPKRTKDGIWSRSLWSYELHYGDYGAKSFVDIRLASFHEHVIAVVFLHTAFRDQEPVKKSILASMGWPRPTEGD